MFTNLAFTLLPLSLTSDGVNDSSAICLGSCQGTARWVPNPRPDARDIPLPASVHVARQHSFGNAPLEASRSSQRYRRAHAVLVGAGIGCRDIFRTCPNGLTGVFLQLTYERLPHEVTFRPPKSGKHQFQARHPIGSKMGTALPLNSTEKLD
jgi:hypothetical protein